MWLNFERSHLWGICLFSIFDKEYKMYYTLSMYNENVIKFAMKYFMVNDFYEIDEFIQKYELQKRYINLPRRGER